MARIYDVNGHEVDPSIPAQLGSLLVVLERIHNTHYNFGPFALMPTPGSVSSLIGCLLVGLQTGTHLGRIKPAGSSWRTWGPDLDALERDGRWGLFMRGEWGVRLVASRALPELAGLRPHNFYMDPGTPPGIESWFQGMSTAALPEHLPPEEPIF